MAGGDDGHLWSSKLSISDRGEKKEKEKRKTEKKIFIQKYTENETFE